MDGHHCPQAPLDHKALTSIVSVSWIQLAIFSDYKNFMPYTLPKHHLDEDDKVCLLSVLPLTVSFPFDKIQCCQPSVRNADTYKGQIGQHCSP